jgi:hypothetical protein
MEKGENMVSDESENRATHSQIHVCYGSKPRWGLRATIRKAATAASLWISWSWTVEGVS